MASKKQVSNIANTLEFILKLKDDASSGLKQLQVTGASSDATLKGLTKTYSDMEGALDNLANGVKVGIVDQETYRQALEATSSTLTEQVNTLDKSSDAYSSALEMLANVKPQLDQVTSSLQTQNLDWGNLAETVKTNFTAGMQQGSSIATASVQSLGASFGAMVSPIGLATAAIGLLSAGAVVANEKFAAFETQMAATASLSAEVSSRIEELRDGIYALGPATGVGPEELAKGLYMVVSAGAKAGTELEILAASARVVTSTGTDMKTVVDAVTTSLNTGLAKNAAEATDKLFQMVNLGKVEMPEVAANFGKVASAADLLGVSMDEVGAVVADATTKGVQAETAFSGLNQLFLNIIKPTKDAQDAAKVLGADLSEAGLKAKGFSGFLADVIAKSGGSSTALAKMFTDVDALKVLLPIAKDKGENFNLMLSRMKDSTGSTDIAFGKMSRTVSGSQAIFKATTDTVLTQIGERMAPLVRDSFLIMNATVLSFVRIFSGIADIVIGTVNTALSPLKALASAVGGLSVALERLGEGDFSGAKAALESIPASVAKNFQGTVDQVLKGLETIGKATEQETQAWTGVVNNFGTAAIKNTPAVVNLGKAGENAGKGLGQTGRSAEEANKLLEGAGKQAELTGAQISSLAKQVYPLVLALEQAKKANDPEGIAKATAALTDWENAHKNAGAAVSLAQTQVAAAMRSVEERTRAAEKATEEKAAADRKATEEAKARAAKVLELSQRLRDLNERFKDGLKDGKASAEDLVAYNRAVRNLGEDVSKSGIKLGELNKTYLDAVPGLRAQALEVIKVTTSKQQWTEKIGRVKDKLREMNTDQLEMIVLMARSRGAIGDVGFVLKELESRAQTAAKELANLAGRKIFTDGLKASVSLEGFNQGTFINSVNAALSAAASALASGVGIPEALEKLNKLMGDAKYPGLEKGLKAGVPAAIAGLEAAIAAEFRTQGFDVPITIKPKLSEIASIAPALNAAIGPVSRGLTEALIAGDWDRVGTSLKNLTGEQLAALQDWLTTQSGPLANAMQELVDVAANQIKPVPIKFDFTAQADALSDKIQSEIGEIKDIGLEIIAIGDDPEALAAKIEYLQDVTDAYETDAAKAAIAALIVETQGYIDALENADEAQRAFDEGRTNRTAEMPTVSAIQDIVLEVDQNSLTAIQTAMEKVKTKAGEIKTEAGQASFDKALAQLEQMVKLAPDVNFEGSTVDLSDPTGEIKQAADDLQIAGLAISTALDGLADVPTLDELQFSLETLQEGLKATADSSTEAREKLQTEIEFIQGMMAGFDTPEIKISTDETALLDLELGLVKANRLYKDGTIDADEYLDRVTGLQTQAGALAGKFGTASDEGRRFAQTQTDLATGSETASTALENTASSTNQAAGSLEEYTGGIDENIQAIADQNEATERQRQTNAETLAGLEEKVAAEARAVETAKLLGNSSDDIAFRLGKEKLALENVIAVLPVGSDSWKKYTADLKAVQDQLDAMPAKTSQIAAAQIKSASDVVQSQNEQFKTAKSLGASNEELQAILKDQIGDLEQLQSHTKVGSKEWFIYAEALAKARGEADSLAQDGLKKVMTGIQQVAGFVTSAANAIKSFSEGGSKDVLGLVGSLTKVAGSIVEVAAGIPGLGAVVSAVVDSITAVVDMAVSAVVGGNKKISEEGRKAAEDAAKLGKEYASSMNAAAGQGFVELGNRIKEASNIAGDFWTNLFNKDWANANAELAGKLTEIKTMAQQAMQGAGQAMATGLKEALNSGDLEGAKRMMLEKLYDTLVNTIITSAAAAATAAAGIDGLIIKMSEAIKAGDWTAALGIVDEITAKAGASFTNFVGQISGKLKNPYAVDNAPKDGSIAKLEQDKAKLEADRGKATTDDQRAALTTEINAKEAEIKRLKNEVVKASAPDGSIAALEQQKRALQEKHDLETNEQQRIILREQIAQQDAQIKKLRGEIDKPAASTSAPTTTDTTKRNTVGGSYASVTSLVASLPNDWLKGFDQLGSSTKRFDSSVLEFGKIINQAERMYDRVDQFYAGLRLNGIEAHVNVAPATSGLPTAVYTK